VNAAFADAMDLGRVLIILGAAIRAWMMSATTADSRAKADVAGLLRCARTGPFVPDAMGIAASARATCLWFSSF